MIQGTDLLYFETHGDDRGSLIAIENNKNIDFKIERVYYIYDTINGVVRGKHAHVDLRQVLICVNGSCDILLDNGKERDVIHLDSPNKGVYIKSLVWREMMNFSDDCVLLVLVNSKHNVNDYIYDYPLFLSLVDDNNV